VRLTAWLLLALAIVAGVVVLNVWSGTQPH
jgi:hypothetical protein